MPWEGIVGGRKDTPDEARRGGIDVAIRADEPGGDGAHPSDDARGACVPTGSFRLNRIGRTSPTSSAHRWRVRKRFRIRTFVGK